MTTAFQPNAWQLNTVQIQGGVNTPVNPYEAFQGFQQNAFQATGGVVSVSGAVCSIHWTEGDDTWSVDSVSETWSTISWTELDDTWALSATAGTATNDLAISWTEDSDSWSLQANEQADSDWWPLVGGRIDKKRITRPDVMPIIEFASVEPNPVTTLRLELKKRDIAYDESYKEMLKAIIKAKAQLQKMEDDDEESILSLIM